MKYPSVQQPEILTEQLRLMNALFRVSLRQHKPRASRTCAQVCKTHLHLSQKREKMRGYTREKMQNTSEGDVIKEKSLTCGKKGHWKHVYLNSFSKGKTPSRTIVYSEPQNTVLKPLSARTERKSQAELQGNKQQNTKSFQQHFDLDQGMLCLVFVNYCQLFLLKPWFQCTFILLSIKLKHDTYTSALSHSHTSSLTILWRIYFTTKCFWKALLHYKEPVVRLNAATGRYSETKHKAQFISLDDIILNVYSWCQWQQRLQVVQSRSTFKFLHTAPMVGLYCKIKHKSSLLDTYWA